MPAVGRLWPSVVDDDDMVFVENLYQCNFSSPPHHFDEEDEVDDVDDDSDDDDQT